MGLDNLAHGDEEQTREPDEPSVSYLYIYENGREELESWPAEARQVMATAYSVVSDGGVVRTTFKRSSQYQNIHHATAELMVGIAQVFENGNFQPLLEFIGPDADAIIEYLQNNEEVAEELQGHLNTEGDTAEAQSAD